MSTERLTGTVTPKQNVTGQLARAEHVGGTRNYPDLLNKPSIEGVELVGNKTLAELNIGAYLRDYPSESQVIAIVNTAIGQIAIPVNTSDLVNDSDFQTGDDVIDAIADAVSGLAIPAKTSDLVNDSNYQTGADVDDAIDKALEDLSIPTKTSELTNDSGFQTSSDVDTAIDTALEDLNIPTKTSDLTNDSGFQTAADVQDAIAEVDIPTRLSDLTNDMTFQTLTQITNLINDAIGSAVGLNFEVVQTLPATGEGGTIYLVPNGGSALIKNVYDEYIWYNGNWEKIGTTEIDLTNYLQRSDVDSALSSTSENPVQNKVVKAALDDKVSKVTGKGLSTNDYTNADKAIVDGVTAALASKADISSIPTKTSDLTNDSNFVSDANYVHTDNNYDATAKGIVDGVTAALADKADVADIPTALADLADDATHRLVTDTDKAAWNGKADSADIPTALADLTDDATHRLVTDTEKSTWNAKADSADIPTKTSDLDNDSGFVTAEDLEDKQDIFQLDTVPTASVDYVGDIIQYVGATTGTYTNGYFYKCDGVSGAPLPYNFNMGKVVLYNGEIHLLGGNGNTEKLNHYKWNGSTWTSVSDLPYAFRNGGAVVYNNEIHILGSDYNNVGTNHYKWDGSTWSLASTLPYSFLNGSAVVFNNEIHLFGFGSTLYEYGCHYKWNGLTWTQLTNGDSGFNFKLSKAVVYDNAIHIFHDNSGWGRCHKKWDGSSWSEVSTTPHGDVYCSAVVVYDNKIHILGGLAESDKTKHYGWDGSAWTELSVLPYSFHESEAVVYDNAIHLLGGFENNTGTNHYKWNGTEWISLMSSYYAWTRIDVQPSSGGSGSDYVQKSGDTMTGDLTVPNLIATSEVTDGKGNTLSGVNGNLAPIESTSTASKSYSVGDYMVFQGQLYRVTSPIQSGGTIIPITNITATTVTDEIGSGSGGGVTGVKGDSENTYRTGNVNLTSANIGALATNGDSQNNTATFTSDDATNPSSFTTINLVESGEAHSSLFQKLSQAVKNIRWLNSNKRTTGAFNAQNDTVSFTTADVSSDSSATSWTSVSQLTSGSTFSTLMNRISAMMKNTRYLYNLLTSTYTTTKSKVFSSYGSSIDSSKLYIVQAYKIGNLKFLSVAGYFINSSSPFTTFSSFEVGTLTGDFASLMSTSSPTFYYGSIQGAEVPCYFGAHVIKVTPLVANNKLQIDLNIDTGASYSYNFSQIGVIATILYV